MFQVCCVYWVCAHSQDVLSFCSIPTLLCLKSCLFLPMKWIGWHNYSLSLCDLLNAIRQPTADIYTLWSNRKLPFLRATAYMLNVHMLSQRHLWKWGQCYYAVLFSPLSPFQWPQNIWPWMTLTGYLALNFVFAPVWLADRTQVRKIIALRLIKIDTYCLRRKSPAWTLVSGDIRFVRIFGRVL